MQHKATLGLHLTILHGQAHCSTPQLTATQCKTLQQNCNTKLQLKHTWSSCTRKHIAAHCSSLQHTASQNFCITLKHTAKRWNILQHTETHCNTLQHTATHCNTPDHLARASTSKLTHYNTLQHTATHCNTKATLQTHLTILHGQAHQSWHLSLEIFRQIWVWVMSQMTIPCHTWMSHVTYEWDMTAESWGERWGAGVETQKNVRGEIGGWGRVPFNETYAPSLSTIHDGA